MTYEFIKLNIFAKKNKLTHFFIVHLVKSKNAFGKQQSDIDLAADAIIFKHLRQSGAVYAAASEEQPKVSINCLTNDKISGNHP